MLDKLIRNPIFWITILTVFFSIILMVRPSEAWFGVPGEWTWSGRPPSKTTLPRWAPAICALIVTALFVIVMDSQWSTFPRIIHAAALAALILAIPVIQVLLVYIHFQFPLESYIHRVIGPHNGFWQQAIGINWLGTYLRAFPENMRSIRDTYIHIATHPPGTILYIWSWRHFFRLTPQLATSIARLFRSYACDNLAFVRLPDADIAAVFGQIIIPVLSGLSVIPMYLWGRMVGGKRSGWRAASLMSLLPTLSLFTMRWDTLYPFFTAAAFASLHKGLTSKTWRWWFLAGFFVSWASFCSFGNAILAPGLALYAFFYIWFEKKSFLINWHYRLLWLSLVIGGYSVWFVFHISTGVSVWELLRITGGIQSELRSAYSYHLWLAYNLGDIFFYSGIPITLPFILEFINDLRLVFSPRFQISQNLASVPVIAFAIIIIIVDLSGLSPGEVARLWLHLNTGIIISAVVWLQRVRNKHSFGWIVVILAVLGLLLSLFLRVSHTGLPSYVPRLVETSDGSTGQLAAFEKGIVLSQVNVAPQEILPGESILVDLTWFATERVDIPYTVYVHLLGEQGEVITQADSMPMDNTLPTTCWVPGETILDRHKLDLPTTVDEGTYFILIGWYDLVSMNRLRLTSPAPGMDAFTLPVQLNVPSNSE